MAAEPQHPLVSVVTPVYNGAEYLEECMESVLRQTYANWEYTVVDNASTDATPEIVARYAARDARVRHLRFEDLVPANANHNRAFGAIAAESEFCKVVQADDWLYPECLERMVGVAVTSDNVSLVSAYRLWDREVDLVGVPYTREVVSGREILRQSLLGGPYVTGAPTALLYRSRLVRERTPFYKEEGLLHADTEAAYWMLTRGDFACVHQVLTFARRQAGAWMEWSSAMSTTGVENLRLLLRYGPEVLTEEEYRSRLRLELRSYAWWHVRQVPKPSRLSGDFIEVHQREIDGILDEARGDAEVRAAMLFIRALLLRGGRGHGSGLPRR
jgi:glycosyltransferase involved in cell wall biosynthesis